jgi:hypothetical protein
MESDCDLRCRVCGNLIYEQQRVSKRLIAQTQLHNILERKKKMLVGMMSVNETYANSLTKRYSRLQALERRRRELATEDLYYCTTEYLPELEAIRHLATKFPEQASRYLTGEIVFIPYSNGLNPNKFTSNR